MQLSAPSSMQKCMDDLVLPTRKPLLAYVYLLTAVIGLPLRARGRVSGYRPSNRGLREMADVEMERERERERQTMEKENNLLQSSTTAI